MEEHIKNSETYLKSMVDKTSGFAIPKNYFNTLEEHLNIKTKEILFSKANSFETPTSYFDELEDTILSKISLEKSTTKVISFKNRIIKAIPLTIAASIALVIGIYNFYPTKTATNFDDIAENEIETWILDNSSTYTSAEIATIIPLESIDVNDFNFSNLENEAIEEYIIYNENTTLLDEIN